MKTQTGIMTLAIILCAAFIMQAADNSTRAKAEPVERAVAALRSEQTKYAAGRSTLFNVCRVAKDLRTVELQMSASSAQRIAAHKRHVAATRILKDKIDKRIEKGVLAPLEMKIIAEELKEAEAQLKRAQDDK
jgi:hypothetical protein